MVCSMDKSAIKSYAIDARKKLIESVTVKAQQLYISADSAKSLRPGAEVETLQANGIFLSPDQLKARERLCSELLRENIPYKPDIFNRKMEEIAYTWFNRLIALRFMEVNDYLPSSIRILSSGEPGRIEPDAIREAERLDYVDQSKIAKLRADTDIGASDRLYKYILIQQCNALSNILPGMFQKINDYTELLMPDVLYTKGGIVYDLVNAVSEDDFRDSVQIIGWLYQFYISEKKDAVFANKKDVKINKDTIPAITQLFTPEWIVKYMVENSLGRLWLESNSNAELRANWKYYVDDAEQEPEVAERLRVMRSESPIKRPEDIKLIDPCMGSGHILVYAFDVLFQIYQTQGYSEREMPNLILRHNIYGLDVDDRAGQLAYFALMMKARSYSRRFFRQDNIPQPMVYAVPETRLNFIGVRYSTLFGGAMPEDERKSCYEDLVYIAELFSKGKDFGSLLKVERNINYDRLRDYIKDVSAGQLSMEDAELLEQVASFDRFIDTAEVLSRKYDVVVTNPPYMVPAPSQSDWINKNYSNSKSDLCVVFIERNLDLLVKKGFLSMITMHSWMFLSSYEKFREKLITSKDIVNMAHLGARAFVEIGGEVVQTTAFVIRGTNMEDYLATYARLVEFNSQQSKENAYLEQKKRYIAKKGKFGKITGNPVAYWLSKALSDAFSEGIPLRNIAQAKAGMTTGDNNRFLRLWTEVNYENVGLRMKNRDEALLSKKKWFPYSKGGGYRRWYGLNEFVVQWENDGEQIKNAKDGNRKIASVRSESLYFREGITWATLSSNRFSCRKVDCGHLFDDKGSTAFMSREIIDRVLGFMNSSLCEVMLNILNPTMSFQSGNIGALPIKSSADKQQLIDETVAYCLNLSRNDWDSFEISWDFVHHPLVRGIYNSKNRLHAELAEKYIEASYMQWQRECSERFATLKTNEEELNRIFIDIYGLQDELAPEVEDKDVTVRKADLGRDIRSFISYAVGCMFGRYSIYKNGIAYAGGKWDLTDYKFFAHKYYDDGTFPKTIDSNLWFMPDEDNIIPIGVADYFDNDIVLRFTEFVRTVYGDNTLSENLNFIAGALYPNGSGTAQERIRRYFLSDFYKDHVKIYQKRPIYWLLDSGKKDGFKALFYLHRYDKFTIARARTDYLHPLQRKYDAEIKRLEMLSDSTENTREKAAYRKEIEALQAKMDECRVYDQVVSHIAHQQIALDLDDGVKVNYEKFQGVEIPKDNGKTEKMDLLGKI